jgi:hypothetical protein
MKQALKALVALCLGSVMFALVYAAATGRSSLSTGVAPLAVLVAAVSAITYLPAHLLWNLRWPSSSALRPIALATCLSVAFFLGLLLIEYYGAITTKATKTIGGGTTFIAGVPTEFWYRASLRSLASAAVAAVVAGYAFWFIFVRRASMNPKS